MKGRTVITCALLILLAPGRSGAQTTEFWLDYYGNWSPPDAVWSYEVNPGFSKAISGASWLDTYIALSATHRSISWFNAEANLEGHYTFDDATEDVLEVRPWLGANFIWPTSGGFLNTFYPSVSLRFEERFFWYQSSGQETTKERLRLRAFARFTLNNATLVEGTYYLLFLAETYVSLDGEAREVSADRRRFQGGLGYVVGPDLRLELQYVVMRTLNTQSNTFENNSQIVWLAVRSFF
jgi:hypothetical protein